MSNEDSRDDIFMEQSGSSSIIHPSSTMEDGDRNSTERVNAQSPNLSVDRPKAHRTKDTTLDTARRRSRSPNRRHHRRSDDSRSRGHSSVYRRDGDRHRHRNYDQSRTVDSRKREFDHDLVYGHRRSASRSRSRDRYRKRKSSGSKGASPLTEFDKLARKEREKARKEGNIAGNSISGMNSHSGTPSRMQQHVIADVPPPNDPPEMDISRTIEQLVQKRVEEELRAKAVHVELEIQKRVMEAKLDLETRIRQQVEAELREEMTACEKREADAKQKCEQLEKQLKAKLEELEESKRKLDEERLEMLEAKRKLEEERNEMRKEREKAAKEEQKVILGKGGTRQKVEFSFGKR